jgi:MtrB/PioB family decaheme-associated outer membrane protein
MTPRDRPLANFLVAVAVRSALAAAIVSPSLALAQAADDDDVKALTEPLNFLQVGGEYNADASDKFGEYNGLYNKGPALIGDVHLAGGDAYAGGSGTSRYSLNGTSLGTTSGSLNATAASQGSWNIGFGLDDLRHQLTDTYQTPFAGAVGGNNFTLPGNFGVIDTGYKPAGFKTAPGTDQLTAQQQADFHADNIHSDRKNTSLTAGYRFSASWDMRIDYNHLSQDGAKLLGVGGDQVNSPVGSRYTWAGQTPLVLPNPTEYATDTVKVAVNWLGSKANATLSYYVSAFHDTYTSLSWENPFIKSPASVPTGTLSAFPTDTISTFPSNLFNQANFAGGYEFTPTTRLSGGLSYGRSEQDATYATTGNVGLTPQGIPQGSLQGRVDITHVDLKLTNHSFRPLTLSAGLKFNERDNNTPSNPYVFNTINEAANQTETSVNAPMSNKKTQADVSADYRLSGSQHLSLSYEYADTKRWCNNAAANNAQGSLDAAATGGWAAYTAATCAQVPDTREDKFTAGYRVHATDSLDLHANYVYSWRKANVSPTFYNPEQAVDNPAGAGAGAEGYEVVGFMAFNEASRHEQVIKAGANWQPGDKLSLSLGGRYTQDEYTDMTYGVQDGHAASVNFDSTYIFNEHRSVSLYASYQDSSRTLTNLYKVTAASASATGLSGTAGETWTNSLQESDTTIGAGARQDGLLAGRLDLTVDVSYSLGNTTYDTAPFAGADLEGNTCSAAFYETCGSAPAIRNSTLRLRLNGSYALGRSGTGGKLIAGYTFQKLGSDDYLYNAYQYGYTPATLLPTNQQAPGYRMNAVFLAYRYSFR